MNKLFDNTETAFAIKSDSDLEKAYFLFKLIKSEPLVRIGSAVTKFALNAHLPVEGLIRATVFDHFCGGINEDDCLPIIAKMYKKNVYSILDYSVEGKEIESQFDLALNKIIVILKYAKDNKAMPFGVFKPTGFGRLELYQKVSEKLPLTEKEKKEWKKVEERYDKVAKTAFDYNVPLLVDAEESWMQPAVDDLLEGIMTKYNKEKVIIYSTLQLYLWDRLDYLKALHEKARKGKFKIGMKLVRGAYMEKERERAQQMGYPDPICKDKEATDKNFDTVQRYMFDHIEDMAIFCGTHNEESSYLLMEMMKVRNINKKDPRVWFGQLYGMSDNISYNLGKEGYNVAKYLPFGPVKDVMPYLLRRAEENTSVAGQTTRELDLITKERKRRKLV